jgi:hypothetical protein
LRADPDRVGSGAEFDRDLTHGVRLVEGGANDEGGGGGRFWHRFGMRMRTPLGRENPSVSL